MTDQWVTIIVTTMVIVSFIFAIDIFCRDIDIDKLITLLKNAIRKPTIYDTIIINGRICKELTNSIQLIDLSLSNYISEESDMIYVCNMVINQNILLYELIKRHCNNDYDKISILLVYLCIIVLNMRDFKEFKIVNNNTITTIDHPLCIEIKFYPSTIHVYMNKEPFIIKHTELYNSYFIRIMIQSYNRYREKINDVVTDLSMKLEPLLYKRFVNNNQLLVKNSVMFPELLSYSIDNLKSLSVYLKSNEDSHCWELWMRVIDKDIGPICDDILTSTHFTDDVDDYI